MCDQYKGPVHASTSSICRFIGPRQTIKGVKYTLETGTDSRHLLATQQSGDKGSLGVVTGFELGFKHVMALSVRTGGRQAAHRLAFTSSGVW